MALDFRDQYFGCEIEMTGLTRQQAARTLAELFGTSITHYGGTYDGYRVADREGKDWKIVSDGSINAFRRSNGRQVPAGREYRVEMNSPKLEYAEMEKLQEVVRALRHAGAFVNDSCGMHVHIDAARHTPKSLKNLLSIMYSKEDILFAALKVDESRTRRWCRRVEEPVLQTIRKLPKDASMEMLKSRWYQGNDGSNDHYDLSRYHPSIYPAEPEAASRTDGMDRIELIEAYREIIKENIEYDLLVLRYGRERLDEALELMLEVILSKRPYIRIAGDDFPREIVKSRFLKINSGHLEYVFDCIDKNTTKVGNIKAYLLAALYNAPATMDSYYRAEVNHDLYGC